MSVARIAAIKDPRKRAVRAQEAWLAAQEIQVVRDTTIQELLDDGVRPSEIARLIGVTNSAISNRFKRRV